MEEDHTEIFAWGLDNKGQLGLGSKVPGKSYTSPRFCSFNVHILELSCGEDHSGFISSTGHVYCMGSNLNGKLGIGDKSVQFSTSPCLVEALAGYSCTKISCGWSHTAVVTSEGILFTWGTGQYGALGTGTLENQYLPVEIKKHVSNVSCGSRHMGVISKNNLWMCGSGEAGQLGTGKRQKEVELVMIEASNVIEIACGEFHSGFINSDGNVFMMGGNSFGQLGIGHKKSVASPNQINVSNALKLACGNHSVCITAEGLFVWGNTVFGEFLTPKKIKVSKNNIVDIAVGGTFALVLDSKSKIFAWGSNSNGELATGDYSSKNMPVEIVSLSGKKIKKIAAGGNFCICLGKSKEKNSVAHSAREYKNDKEEMQVLMNLLQEEKKKNKKLTEEIDEIQRVNVEFKENLQSKLQETNTQYQQISSESFALKSNLNECNQLMQVLKSENFHLKEENSRFKKTLENNAQGLKSENFANKLKEKHYLEMQQMQEQLEKERVLKKQIERDLEVACSHKNRLENALSKQNNQLEEKFHEKEKGLLKVIDDITNEKNKILKENDELMGKNKELQKDIEIMLQENKFYSENTKELHMQQEKLQKIIQEMKNIAETQNKTIKKHEIAIEMISNENQILKSTIFEIENRNKELVSAKNQEMFTKTREFKEKTLNILTPKVPSLKSAMPQIDLLNEEPIKSNRKELSATQKERLNNAVHFMIENKEFESPSKFKSVDEPEKGTPQGFEGFETRQGSFTFRKAITPSKDDVKAKIALLMQNRTRIEKKLQLLQNEQENLYLY